MSYWALLTISFNFQKLGDFPMTAIFLSVTGQEENIIDILTFWWIKSYLIIVIFCAHNSFFCQNCSFGPFFVFLSKLSILFNLVIVFIIIVLLKLEISLILVCDFTSAIICWAPFILLLINFISLLILEKVLTIVSHITLPNYLLLKKFSSTRLVDKLSPVLERSFLSISRMNHAMFSELQLQQLLSLILFIHTDFGFL